MGLRGPKSRTLEEVLEVIQDNSYLEEATGCYVWTGCVLDSRGYGLIRFDGKQWLIHRLIYIHVDPIKNAVEVMHTCDNPSCWNPEHLVGGTHQDNIDDMVAKGRQNRGENQHRAVLTEDAVKDILTSSLSTRQLAIKYNIHHMGIHRVRKRITWKHVKLT